MNAKLAPKQNNYQEISSFEIKFEQPGRFQQPQILSICNKSQISTNRTAQFHNKIRKHKSLSDKMLKGSMLSLKIGERHNSHRNYIFKSHPNDSIW